MLTTTAGVPQPWEGSEVSRSEYLEWASKQEAAGAILVIETLVNAYPVDEEGGWIVDHVIHTDWRTGEHRNDYDPEVDQPDLAGTIVVERRLAEA